MKKMILNFRKPTLVIIGAWNEAILSRPEWLGRYAYDYEEGAPVEALQVYEENPVTHLTRLIQYIEDIGFFVERGRLSIFLNVDHNFENIFTSLEEKVIRVVDTLHHTPIGGYGVNFSFEVPSPSEDLLGSFETADNIKKKYAVKGEKHSLALELVENVTLNLIKENLKDRVILDFNYHHEKLEFQNFKEKINGTVFKFYDQTLDILKNCYEVDVEHIDVVRHSFKEVSNGGKKESN